MRFSHVTNMSPIGLICHLVLSKTVLFIGDRQHLPEEPYPSVAPCQAALPVDSPPLVAQIAILVEDTFGAQSEEAVEFGVVTPHAVHPSQHFGGLCRPSRRFRWAKCTCRL